MCNGCWGVVGRDGFGLRRIGAPGYRAHSSVAMARMFKAIRLGRNVSGFKPTCTCYNPYRYPSRLGISHCLQRNKP